MKTINMALIGLGTVGGGVVHILEKHHDDFMRHLGVDVRLVACYSRRKSSAEKLGIGHLFVGDVDDILCNPDIDIVVELVGGTGAAKDYVLSALRNGKHVVTANKALIATYGKEVFDAAAQGGVGISFDGSVGGGIPIIGPFKHSLIANQITLVMGILNGTTNYMLTRMDDDEMSYADALLEAQQKGFAEADPSADVDGLDAAAKIAILATIAFNSRVTLSDVHTEGIATISPQDLKFARGMGYVVKLLAIGRKVDGQIDVRVHPAMLPNDHPLASVNGVFNAIYIEGDSVGQAMFFGEGAGAGPAASAVMGDVLETAMEIAEGRDVFRGSADTDSYPFVPMDQLETEYYIRIPVVDQPGVFAEIATCFANHKVSIKSVVQRGGDGKTTELMVITHTAKEHAMMGAIDDMRHTDVIIDEPQLIRLVH